MRRSTSTPAARSTTGHERPPAAAAEEGLDSPPRRLGVGPRACLRGRNRARAGARGQPAAGVDGHARPDADVPAAVDDGDRHDALTAMSQKRKLWVDSAGDAP